MLRCVPRLVHFQNCNSEGQHVYSIARITSHPPPTLPPSLGSPLGCRSRCCLSAAARQLLTPNRSRPARTAARLRPAVACRWTGAPPGARGGPHSTAAHVSLPQASPARCESCWTRGSRRPARYLAAARLPAAAFWLRWSAQWPPPRSAVQLKQLVPYVPQLLCSLVCLAGAAVQYGDELRCGHRLRRLRAGTLQVKVVGTKADGDCGADGILQQCTTAIKSTARQYPHRLTWQAVPNL